MCEDIVHDVSTPSFTAPVAAADHSILASFIPDQRELIHPIAIFFIDSP